MSSVFINREDTSISVAVMHTGWALMKTDALSEKKGGQMQVGGLQPASQPVSQSAQAACRSKGNPDDNKMRSVYLINQASVVP